MSQNVFDNVPTNETQQILLKIHSMQQKSNELVGTIQAFQSNEIRLDGRQIMQLLITAKEQLKEQNRVLVQLVEQQLTLDDNLKAITKQMD